MYKVFVGTLYCGENDYSECCNAIARQTNNSGLIQFEHITISNLPEHEAHNLLWKEWRSRQQEYDLFVKIDADTILRHDSILEKIVYCFSENTRLTGLQAPLHDFFTDSNISGLNCFSSKVTFKDTNNNLYCDRVDIGHDVVYREHELPKDLVPAGYHCFHASPKQAFHFGLHRALKNQSGVIDKTRKAWLDHDQDIIRGYALAGAIAARQFHNTGFNYIDRQFLEAFDYATQNLQTIIKDLV